MDIIKKNSSSPFQLQRSMVDQGGSGGAYEAGGFNPSTVFNNDAANAAVESLGKVIGAALYAKGKDKKEDKPKFDTKGAEEARDAYEKELKTKKEKEDVKVMTKQLDTNLLKNSWKKY